MIFINLLWHLIVFLFASNRLSALSKGFLNSLVDGIAGIAQSALAVVWNDVWLFDCFDKKCSWYSLFDFKFVSNVPVLINENFVNKIPCLYFLIFDIFSRYPVDVMIMI